jgi:hypothetical protein
VFHGCCRLQAEAEEKEEEGEDPLPINENGADHMEKNSCSIFLLLRACISGVA